MSDCKALTLSEGLKRGPDVNGAAKFAEKFAPAKAWIEDLRSSPVGSPHLV